MLVSLSPFPPFFLSFFFLFPFGKLDALGTGKGEGRRCVTLLQEVGKTATLLSLPLSVSLSLLSEGGRKHTVSLPLPVASLTPSSYLE